MKAKAKKGERPGMKIGLPAGRLLRANQTTEKRGALNARGRRASVLRKREKRKNVSVSLIVPPSLPLSLFLFLSPFYCVLGWGNEGTKQQRHKIVTQPTNERTNAAEIKRREIETFSFSFPSANVLLQAMESKETNQFRENYSELFLEHVFFCHEFFGF